MSLSLSLSLAQALLPTVRLLWSTAVLVCFLVHECAKEQDMSENTKKLSPTEEEDPVRTQVMCREDGQLLRAPRFSFFFAAIARVVVSIFPDNRHRSQEPAQPISAGTRVHVDLFRTHDWKLRACRVQRVADEVHHESGSFEVLL